MNKESRIVIEPYDWLGARVSVCGSRVTVEGVGCARNTNFYPLLLFFLCFIALMYLMFWTGDPVARDIVYFISPFLFVFSLFVFRVYKNKYIIDVKRGRVYKDFFWFRYPSAKISEYGGIDAVLCVRPNTNKRGEMITETGKAFYKMWFKNDRFGWGIPISGPIRLDSDSLADEFQRHVLSLFREHGVSVNEVGEVDLNSFAGNSVSDIEVAQDDVSTKFLGSGVKNFYIYTRFDRAPARGVWPARAILKEVKMLVLLHKGRREIKEVAGFRVGLFTDEWAAFGYQMNILREALDGHTGVFFVDDRFDRLYS